MEKQFVCDGGHFFLHQYPQNLETGPRFWKGSLSEYGKTALLCFFWELQGQYLIMKIMQEGASLVIDRGRRKVGKGWENWLFNIQWK